MYLEKYDIFSLYTTKTEPGTRSGKELKLLYYMREKKLYIYKNIWLYIMYKYIYDCTHQKLLIWGKGWKKSTDIGKNSEISLNSLEKQEVKKILK